MRIFALVAVLVLGWTTLPTAAAPGSTSPVTACGQCHGNMGDSDKPLVPRLAGQQMGYLAAQLKNFRAHKRDDAHARAFMWGTARRIDDKTFGDIAQYFARQTPAKPQIGGSLAAEGERLFLAGDAAKGVVACQLCHGKAGEGQDTTPRIAGQHAAYFRLVMGAFRSGQRQNDQMSAVSRTLSDHQIEALSSYLAND